MKSYKDPLHFGYDRLTVNYNGKEYLLNKAMLDRQNCWTNLEEIKDVNWLKLLFCDMIRDTHDSAEMKELAKDIEQCDFELQRLYGFDEDANFHRFWEYPKCKCPWLDNSENWGIKYHIIDMNCPLHGE